MTAMQSDFTGLQDRWMTHLREIADLADKLPDGAARMDDFATRMLAASDPEQFILREAHAGDGVIVVHVLPGPLAMSFLDELRQEIAAKAGAA